MNFIAANGAMAHPVTKPASSTGSSSGGSEPGSKPESKQASGLKTRVLSALVLLPVVLGLLYLGGLSFALLMAAVAVLMAGEWDRLTGGPGFGLLGICAGLVLLLVLTLGHMEQVDWALLALMPGVVIVAVLAWVKGRKVVWPILGLAWLGLPVLALLVLRMGDGGMAAVSWLFLCVWSCDTGAYFAGRGIGGPKLAPRISPNKTWAGLLGGMAAAGLVSILLAVFFAWDGVMLFAVMGAVLAAISQCGDLAESWVKRTFDVKDSGALIPGHGGILDRVDGILFAAPVVALISLAPGFKLLPWQ
jgi:phosphatidate cytidylyltransferase